MTLQLDSPGAVTALDQGANPALFSFQPLLGGFFNSNRSILRGCCGGGTTSVAKALLRGKSRCGIYRPMTPGHDNLLLMSQLTG